MSTNQTKDELREALIDLATGPDDRGYFEADIDRVMELIASRIKRELEKVILQGFYVTLEGDTFSTGIILTSDVKKQLKALSNRSKDNE